MRRFSLLALAALILIPNLTALHGQSDAAPGPVEDRRKALNALFDQFWEASLEHSPEFASSIGDKRYNDQISDYSVKALNAWVEREQNYMLKLAAIDPTGFNDSEKTSREIMMRDFAEDIESTEFKEWEMPVDQMCGIYSSF